MDISIATARVTRDLLKALAILSDTTVKRAAVDREDLNPYRKPLASERVTQQLKSYTTIYVILDLETRFVYKKTVNLY